MEDFLLPHGVSRGSTTLRLCSGRPYVSAKISSQGREEAVDLLNQRGRDFCSVDFGNVDGGFVAASHREYQRKNPCSQPAETDQAGTVDALIEARVDIELNERTRAFILGLVECTLAGKLIPFLQLGRAGVCKRAEGTPSGPKNTAKRLTSSR